MSRIHCFLNTAPIALFVYSRPYHVAQTLDALRANRLAESSDLIVFSDAAKHTEHDSAVAEIRRYLREISGFRSVHIIERQTNYGLARNIIEGVTQICREYDRVIVLEDDLITSPYFIDFMNEALNYYAENSQVASIHGYCYPTGTQLPETFFLRGADCWGWATWRRSWELFNPDGQTLLKELKRRKLIKAFDLNGAYSYSRMLEGQIKGINDSWAVRWHASAFLAGKLTLYPGRSLVHNIGNDGSGTHCGTSSALNTALSELPVRLKDVRVEESAVAKKAIERFFRSQHTPTLLNRLVALSVGHKMRTKLSRFAHDCLPPVLVRRLRRLMRTQEGVRFEGSFETWEEAARRSTGYDSEQILEKVLASTLKVKKGEAAYERDSVLFDEIQYAWPVTAGLMWAAARSGGYLSVLDFGGSLGSSFFQNRKFLAGLANVRWSVVEQEHFVKAGREHIQDNCLAFYTSIEECLDNEKPNVILLSSVLQYLKEPFKSLDKLVNSDAEVILLDRTPFHERQVDQVVIQQVPRSIYLASYPMWIFSREKFFSHISMRLDLVSSYLAPEGYVSFGKESFSFNSFLFQRSDS